MNSIRQAILSKFSCNKHGIICTPGPYIGEYLYVPYYHKIIKDGGEDSSLDDGTKICKVADDERTAFPELKDTPEVRIKSDGNTVREIIEELQEQAA